MRYPVIVRAIFFALAGWALAHGSAFAAPPLASELVKPALYAESATVAPGGTLWTELHLTVAPGWHIYWKNPGDSGLPTELDWSLPPGFSAGAIEWPVPERFSVGPIANYGYTGSADLLAPLDRPGGARRRRQAASRGDGQISRLLRKFAFPARRRSRLTWLPGPARQTRTRRRVLPRRGGRCPLPRRLPLGSSLGKPRCG